MDVTKAYVYGCNIDIAKGNDMYAILNCTPYRLGTVKCQFFFDAVGLEGQATARC